MQLTDRFAEALTFAERLHRDQRRKGNDVPYIAHLMTVSATVLEHGGDEDVAIAALLHDAVEDQGGLERLREIEAKFGARVARTVASCSDSVTTDPADKAPWEERKRAYVAHLAEVDADVALVVAADKLHNLTATIRDVRRDGPATLARFNAGPERILWYYAAVAAAIGRHRATAPVGELEQGVTTFAALLGLAVPAEEGTDVGPVTRVPNPACACLQSGPTFPDIVDEKHLGWDETEGRFADVTLKRCGRCGRLWLKYLVEREFYTNAGRWGAAPIDEDDAATMTPEAAAAFLDAAEWVIVGGGFYGHGGGRSRGPLMW
jgi:HD domain